MPLLTRGVSLLALTLAACGGIGDGNAPQSLEIRIGGNAEDPEVFVCASQVPQAILSFTDDTAGDFVSRVSWSSSNTDVLDVSDGGVEGPAGFFINGALLPKAPGTATLRAEYLSFSDEITVTVSPTTLSLGPARSELLIDRGISLVDTLVHQGRDRFFSQDFNQVGSFSVDGVDADAENPPLTVNAVNGLTTVAEAGEFTLRYRVDFCDQEATAVLVGLDERLQSLRVTRRGDDTPISTLELLPDTSAEISVIGEFEGGAERDVTSLVRFAFEDAAGETEENVAFSTLRGIGTITAFAKPTTVEGEEPPTFPLQAVLKISFDPTPLDETEAEENDDIFADDIAIRVLDVDLLADTLTVSPSAPTMLPATGLSLSARADFSGPGGEFTAVDVTKDVQWFSSETTRLTINNTIGSKGFAFAAGSRLETVDDEVQTVTNFGSATATARRFSRAATDESNPEASTEISIGRPDAEEGEEPLSTAVAAALSLTLREAAPALGLHDEFGVQAVAELQRDGVAIAEQDLSGQVIWDLIQADDFARISNASGRKGVVTVLTDQQVTITVRARYRDSRVQDDTVTGTLDVQLNPAP